MKKIISTNSPILYQILTFTTSENDKSVYARCFSKKPKFLCALLWTVYKVSIIVGLFLERPRNGLLFEQAPKKQRSSLDLKSFDEPKVQHWDDWPNVDSSKKYRDFTFIGQTRTRENKIMISEPTQSAKWRLQLWPSQILKKITVTNFPFAKIVKYKVWMS